MKSVNSLFILSLLYFAVFGETFAGWDWRGHNRLIMTANAGFTPQKDWEYSRFQSVINHRSTLLYTSQNHSLESAYEIFPNYQNLKNISLNTLLGTKFKYRAVDLNTYLMKDQLDNKNSLNIIQNLDRFSYTYSADWGELKVGRQPIAFGSARTINPLDTLVPFNFLVINFEQRIGVDGVRAKIPYSDMGLVDFGVVVDRNLSFREDFKFFSLRDTLGPLDAKIMYQSLHRHNIFGLDLQSSIYGWGTWLEFGYFDMKNRNNFVRASMGGQYHFSNDLDFFMEYHFNGANSLNSDVAIFVRDKNYFNLGFSYPFTPLDTFSITFYNNLQIFSNLALLSYEKNISENWYVVGGLYEGLGTSNSEFGQYPQILTLNLKSFF